VRPLGGLLFGRIGDLLGRNRAMMLSVMAMAFLNADISYLWGRVNWLYSFISSSTWGW